MTQTLLVFGAATALALLYYVSRNLERLLGEARQIRQALERQSPPS